jgi:hypothetical protein
VREMRRKRHVPDMQRNRSFGILPYTPISFVQTMPRFRQMRFLQRHGEHRVSASNLRVSFAQPPDLRELRCGYEWLLAVRQDSTMG